MAIAPVESSSVVINSTNGLEMPMSLISVKESKAGSFIQVVPEYAKLKNKCQMMWEQKDCDAYLKTASVLAAYVDQSISTNTFYNPAHFADRKIPTTLIAKNLMQAHYWGLKTFYYSLINKAGSKQQDEEAPALEIIDFDEKHNLILQSDAGEKDLTTLDQNEYELYLKESLDLILKLQEIKPIEIISSRSFDYNKLNFEINHTYNGYEKFITERIWKLFIPNEKHPFSFYLYLFIKILFVESAVFD
jgi:ribonucleotide reductase alpha subunit